MTKRVLVACASKHGATLEINDVIAGVLSRRGLDVVDKPIGELDGVATYDAAVLGSAVYVGRWMSEASRFVKDHAERLRSIPVWLYSSGPLGDPPLPKTDPLDIAELTPLINPRGQQTFTGRLDTAALGLGEKLIVGVVRAPAGDYRAFGLVEQWAHQIADELIGDGPAADGADAARAALLTAARR